MLYVLLNPLHVLYSIFKNTRQSLWGIASIRRLSLSEGNTLYKYISAVPTVSVDMCLYLRWRAYELYNIIAPTTTLPRAAPLQRGEMDLLTPPLLEHWLQSLS